MLTGIASSSRFSQRRSMYELTAIHLKGRMGRGLDNMGLLTDFIVATREDALQYTAFFESGNPLPPDRFQIAAHKNFTDLSLGILWAALCNEEWRVERHELEHLGEPTEGGPWLFHFPVEFTRLLSSVDSAALDRIAGAWVGEDVPGNADELKPVLHDLRNLAGQARLNGKDLCLWVSL
jgi:hypothetical protein